MTPAPQDYRRGPGYVAGRVAGPKNITALIERLRPVATSAGLIRIGGDKDGGYLIPDDLEGIGACFSPGVSTTADFETDLAETYRIRSHMADFSVDNPPLKNPLFDFEKKFLGTTNDDRFIRLEDWVARKTGDIGAADCLLQMDIEGSEFEVFIDTPPAVLRRFRIMVVEFHALHTMMERISHKLFKLVFDKILNDFHVVHIHPNNCCPVYRLGKIEIPAVMEFTFYRKDRATLTGDALGFPHPLDRKNLPRRPDLALPEIWRPVAP